MDNKFNGGMMDIGSMSMGMSQVNNNKGNQNKKSIISMAGKHGIITVIVAAVIILLIVTPFLAGKADESKAKRAFTTLVQVETGEKKVKDVKWEKFYPDEIAEYFEEVIETGEGDFEIDIMEMVKISGKENVGLLEKGVMKFVEGIDIDFNKKDINVSKGYLVIFNANGVGFGYALVAKVNGRYGVYFTKDLGLF